MHNQIYLVLKKKKRTIKTNCTEALLPWRNDVRKWSLIINTNKMRMTSMQLNPVFVFVRVQLDHLPFLRCFHFYARLNVLSWNPLNADKIRALNSCNETFVSLFLSKQRDSFDFFLFQCAKLMTWSFAQKKNTSNWWFHTNAWRDMELNEWISKWPDLIACIWLGMALILTIKSWITIKTLSNALGFVWHWAKYFSYKRIRKLYTISFNDVLAIPNAFWLVAVGREMKTNQ